MKTRHGSEWRITNAMFLAIAPLILLVACDVQSVEEQPTVTSLPRSTVDVDPEVEEALKANTMARVKVWLNMSADVIGVKELLEQITLNQDSLLSQVPNEHFELEYKYRSVPALVGFVTSDGLNALRNRREVRSVDLETSDPMALVESTTLIRAYDVWRDYGLTGDGVTVAILDTGVDNHHPDLSASILDQHCFVACLSGDSTNAQDDNGHGTHVAGIIASRGQFSPRGVAPDAGIVAVRVMDSTGAYRVSDFVAGIDWVVANQTRLSIKIINLGMHSDQYSGVCDAEVDARLVDALTRARQAGMIVLAPAGNGGLAEMMAAPACISNVVSVSMTDKAGRLSRGNSSSALDLLAPGELIISAALGGGETTYNGTSHASPHAAAVVALMLQASPNLSTDEIERILKETGVPVTDDRTGRSTPRIDAHAAVTQVLDRKSD